MWGHHSQAYNGICLDLKDGYLRLRAGADINNHEDNFIVFKIKSWFKKETAIGAGH